MTTRVACVGECMIELREQPDGLLSRGFGGDTLNTALYLARLGVMVDYVTALGTDSFSAAMLRAWQAEGVGTGLVLQLPGRLPGLYLIQTDASGERRFSYWRDSAPVRRLFDAPDAARIEAFLPEYDLIYLSGITLSLFDAAGRGRLFDALDRARSRGGRVAFDTNFRPRGWPDHALARAIYDQMLARSDIVLASVEDHALLFQEGGRDQTEATVSPMRWLDRAGNAEIVLKLERLGCRVLSGETDMVVSYMPAASVVDTTAAGDSFAAGYIAARLSGATPDTAARAGHRLARIVVSHPGAIIPLAAMPDPDPVGQ